MPRPRLYRRPWPYHMRVGVGYLGPSDPGIGVMLKLSGAAGQEAEVLSHKDLWSPAQ